MNERTILFLSFNNEIIVDAIEGKESILHEEYPDLTIESREVSAEFYQEIVENGGLIKY